MRFTHAQLRTRNMSLSERFTLEKHRQCQCTDVSVVAARLCEVVLLKKTKKKTHATFRHNSLILQDLCFQRKHSEKNAKTTTSI